MSDFLFQHRSHQVRHGPHALADLRMAGQATLKTDIDIPLLISANPCGLLHVALADHRASFHRRMDFVAGAVEEASIDEDHTFFCCADCFLEVDRGAALLIHDADLQRIRLHAE